MASKTIKLSTSDYEDLHKNWISKSLQEEQKVMSEFRKQELDLLYRFVSFTYQTLIVVGILAGFGFTAIGSVVNIKLFISGQFLLISSILFGLFWIKKFYESNLENIQGTSSDIFDIYKKRDRVFLEIGNDFSDNQTLDKSKMKKAHNFSLEILEYLGKNKGKKEEKLPHIKILVFSLIGIGLVLLSFIVSYETVDRLLILLQSLYKTILAFGICSILY